MRSFTLLRTWKRLQVSYYGGRYSVHRLLALETYTKTTPLWRVLLVCVGTPLPMAILIFIQESMPLRDPRDGWSANYGQWIRAMMLTFVITYSTTSPVGHFIDGITFSQRQLILLCSCVSVLVSACTMVIAAYVIFPIPFSVLTMTPVYNIVYIISFRLVMGADVIRRTKTQPEQFKRYMDNLHAQILMMFVYPAYEVLFRTAEGSHYHLLVIWLLPVIKVVIKNIMRRCTMHAEDMVPEAVIFTVDFFNAIYVATCMQTASSTLSVVAITVTDLSQTIIMLYGLYRRTAVISSTITNTAESPLNTMVQDKFLNVVCSLCRNSEKLKKQVRAGIKIRSCFSYYLFAEDISLLDTLDATTKADCEQSTKSSEVIPVPTASDIPFRENISNQKSLFCLWNRNDSVYPTVDLVNLTTPSNGKKNRKVIRRKTTEHPTFFGDSLEALFTIECLVLTTYLEAVIPLFYTTYIIVMVHLPSATFHSEMAGITPETVGGRILPVFMFGLLEVASFALLAAMIKQNCMMRAWYQLAFVLESQKLLIQTKLIVWMMITLCFRVMHFGTFCYTLFAFRL
ncbi:hypothetical protein PHMEG_00019305 [Phytophthora megakarya]|uniref:Transmembrane protein n=1 Tax=Phytophthora megakarya TaxID=4795 RepID=A0A225VRM7_9STRA|nr:hypothetical protein PHMEG_00019305 [Phytophthora megakarya]